MYMYMYHKYMYIIFLDIRGHNESPEALCLWPSPGFHTPQSTQTYVCMHAYLYVYYIYVMCMYTWP